MPKFALQIPAFRQTVSKWVARHGFVVAAAVIIVVFFATGILLLVHLLSDALVVLVVGLFVTAATAVVKYFWLDPKKAQEEKAETTKKLRRGLYSEIASAWCSLKVYADNVELLLKDVEPPSLPPIDIPTDLYKTIRLKNPLVFYELPEANEIDDFYAVLATETLKIEQTDPKKRQDVLQCCEHALYYLSWVIAETGITTKTLIECSKKSLRDQPCMTEVGNQVTGWEMSLQAATPKMLSGTLSVKPDRRFELIDQTKKFTQLLEKADKNNTINIDATETDLVEKQVPFDKNEFIGGLARWVVRTRGMQGLTFSEQEVIDAIQEQAKDQKGEINLDKLESLAKQAKFDPNKVL